MNNNHKLPTKFRFKCVGEDTYEVKIKKGLFWKTLYDGDLPLKVKKKDLNNIPLYVWLKMVNKND